MHHRMSPVERGKGERREETITQHRMAGSHIYTQYPVDEEPGLVPRWSRDSQSNSGVRGYSATGVVVVAGLVPGWSRDCAVV